MSREGQGQAPTSTPSGEHGQRAAQGGPGSGAGAAVFSAVFWVLSGIRPAWMFPHGGGGLSTHSPGMGGCGDPGRQAGASLALPPSAKVTGVRENAVETRGRLGQAPPPAAPGPAGASLG